MKKSFKNFCKEEEDIKTSSSLEFEEFNIISIYNSVIGSTISLLASTTLETNLPIFSFI